MLLSMYGGGNMPIVPAKCTQCGANIDIDSTRDAGICQYCGTAFITEKAINHFNNTYNIQNATIHVSGVDIENLLIRAVQFEKKNDREKALEYYNRVLDIDAFRVEALEGIERLSQVYFGKVALKHDEVEKFQYLIKQGDKLEAIRQIRILTGLSLVEAKNYVDNFEATGKWFASNLKSAPTIHSAVQSSFDSLNICSFSFVSIVSLTESSLICSSIGVVMFFSITSSFEICCCLLSILLSFSIYCFVLKSFNNLFDCCLKKSIFVIINFSLYK
jgi:ribosomal protein L7/L12